MEFFYILLMNNAVISIHLDLQWALMVPGGVYSSLLRMRTGAGWLLSLEREGRGALVLAF